MIAIRAHRVTVSCHATLAFVFCLVFVTGGCRSTATPFTPLATTGPRETWNALDGVRRGFRGARSQATIRFHDGGAWRSVRARLVLDSSGRLLVDFFTPFGTPAATLFVDGASVTWIDHIQQIWWSQTGGASIPIIGSLPGGREAALLLFGLPPSSAGSAPVELEGLLAAPCGVWNCSMTANGLIGASAATGEVSVELMYRPPAFPPGIVTLRVSGPGAKSNEIRIEHIEILAEKVTLHRPAAPQKYRNVLP